MIFVVLSLIYYDLNELKKRIANMDNTENYKNTESKLFRYFTVYKIHLGRKWLIFIMQ